MNAPMRALLLALVALQFAFVPARADELRVGMRNEPSIDPHFLYLSPNIGYARHIFSPLVTVRADGRLEAALAESWSLISETEWEFKLRAGVRFHDGTPFTAEDVIFSFDRVRTLPNNPGPYTSALRSIASVRAIDPLTLRITTTEPHPGLPGRLNIIAIVSKNIGSASPGDFTTGKAAIGTGPFKFVEFVPRDRLLLRRNDDYWGQKTQWSTVTMRIIPNDSARVAALLAGTVDAIDVVPTQDAARIKSDPNLYIDSVGSLRIMYLAVNIKADTMEWFTDAQGKPLETNPFRNLRVRQAIAKAIDRKVLVDRGLQGFGTPTAQMSHAAFESFDPSLTVEAGDAAGAKKLLAEAGYPDGLGVALHCPSGRYNNDAVICQMIGGMLARAGFKMKVEALPTSVFFSRARAAKNEFALVLLGWGQQYPGMTTLTDVMHSFNAKSGFGANSRGANSDGLDKLIQGAAATFKADERTALMKQVHAESIRETLHFPLYLEAVTLAARKSIKVVVRVDEQTIVTDWQKAN